MSKVNTMKKELKALTAQDLAVKADAFQRELFSLRLHAATSTVKDNTQFRKRRKDIARALTYLRQKMSQLG